MAVAVSEVIIVVSLAVGEVALVFCSANENAAVQVKNSGSAVKKISKAVAEANPKQVHHFATNKSKKYTKQFEDIIKKYNLKLDDDWNKALMPHQGRHPYAYHEYVLREMTKYDNIARGDKETFLKLYEQLKNKIINNPEMLTKDYWK